MERIPISKKIRFEVFKRDQFTCQYCGRMAPDVILEVDHIDPVAEGGTNDIMNLITSCRDCNRGKGKNKLSDKKIISLQQQSLKELAEKREQLEMVAEWKKELLNYNTQAINMLSDYFEQLTGSSVNEHGRKKINVYDAFVEGAKEGFTTAVRIIPYLVAILVAIGVFRVSGCMDYLIEGIANLVSLCGINSDFVGALPTALMKPLSGSGARGLMVDAMNTYGADSFVGRLSCIFQGSTDTTFYILAVYFGSVGVVRTRHAVPCGLLADLAGIIAAILICYLFFN